MIQAGQQIIEIDTSVLTEYYINSHHIIYYNSYCYQCIVIMLKLINPSTAHSLTQSKLLLEWVMFTFTSSLPLFVVVFITYFSWKEHSNERDGCVEEKEIQYNNGGGDHLSPSHGDDPSPYYYSFTAAVVRRLSTWCLVFLTTVW